MIVHECSPFGSSDALADIHEAYSTYAPYGQGCHNAHIRDDCEKVFVWPKMCVQFEFGGLHVLKSVGDVGEEEVDEERDG